MKYLNNKINDFKIDICDVKEHEIALKYYKKGLIENLVELKKINIDFLKWIHNEGYYKTRFMDFYRNINDENLNIYKEEDLYDKFIIIYDNEKDI